MIIAPVSSVKGPAMRMTPWLWLNEENRDQRVAWRGSQEQLARLLGLSRVTVNRALARLAQAGAVRLTARGIVIADRIRLDAFVGD
jgi:CRP/FNR family transcriptional regulator, cyclic AMP receptor protein